MRLIDADAFDKCLEQVEIEATKSRKYVFSSAINTIRGNLANAPTIEPQTTQLTDEDKETIRIHLNAFKESLCNQGRWYEATEYEELIIRLLSTASVQPEWIPVSERLPEFRHVINPDPEEDGEWDESPFVLVCFDDGDIECRQFIREDGRVFIYPEEFRGRKPVAWQPLPDPWKEEE